MFQIDPLGYIFIAMLAVTLFLAYIVSRKPVTTLVQACGCAEDPDPRVQWVVEYLSQIAEIAEELLVHSQAISLMASNNWVYCGSVLKKVEAIRVTCIDKNGRVRRDLYSVTDTNQLALISKSQVAVSEIKIKCIAITFETKQDSKFILEIRMTKKGVMSPSLVLDIYRLNS